MSPFIYQEGHFWLASVVLGAGIAAVYDCLRIFRRVVSHGIFWISLEDLLYWIAVSVGIFCMLYYENNGAFRWFSILGAGAGMGLYKVTAGRLFVKYVSALLLWVKGIFRRLFGWLMRPLRRGKRFIFKKAGAGSRRAKSVLRLVKKRLTVQFRLIRMELHTRYRKADRKSETWSEEKSSSRRKNRID